MDTKRIYCHNGMLDKPATELSVQATIMRLSGRAPHRVEDFAVRVFAGLVRANVGPRDAARLMLARWDTIRSGASWGSQPHFVIAQLLEGK